MLNESIQLQAEHLSSPPAFSGVRVTRSLDSYVCFVYRCLSFCNFFTIVLSVLRYTDSDWYLQTLIDNECHFVSGKNSVLT